MKNFSHTLYWLLLLLLIGGKVEAQQITFIPPGFSSNTASDFSLADRGTAITPASGTLSPSPARNVNFTITIYKSSNYVEDGYVSIYSGITGPDNQITFDRVGSNSTTTGVWASSNGIDRKILSGIFNTSNIRTGDTKLYAVFYSESLARRTAVSVPININQPTTPSGPNNPGGPSSPLSNRLLCIDYGTSIKLTSPYNVEVEPGKLVWEVSTNGVDYEEVLETRSKNTYTTPLIFNRVYYKLSYYSFGALEGSIRYQIDVKASTPIVPWNAQYITCGGAVTLNVDNPGISRDARTYNWFAPTGWRINGQGNVLTTARNLVEVTPPAGIPSGAYQVRVNSTGTCGPTSLDAVVSVRVEPTPAPPPINGSFAITRYEGCRKIYGVVVEAAQGSGYYQYSASTNTGFGGSVISDQVGGFITIPLEMQGPADNVTASISVTGPCGISSNFTVGPQFIQGPDPGCSDPGGGQTTSIVGVYPNPANESISLPQDISGVVIINSKGRVVKEVRGTELVDIRDLPEGLYYLRMQKGRKIVNQQIQITH